MKGSEFVYDYVDLLHYRFHRISLNRGGSYIDSPKWLINKKATINPKNNDDKCFQVIENIEKDPQRISKIKPLLINIIGKK